MENYPNETQTPYAGYRGKASTQPHESPNNEEIPVEGYQSPADEGFQQPERPYNVQQQLYEVPPWGEFSANERTSMGLRACTAACLCYVGGWITGLIFFLLEKENRFVRFHAIQSIIFFGGMSILTAVLGSISSLGFIASGLGIVSFVCWIVLMIAAGRGRYYKLPIIGDYAERLANTYKG